MILTGILGSLAILSFSLLLWQWVVARSFPLHRRIGQATFAPAVTLLKPLKGGDEHTEHCLRSWLRQEYPGDMQILFAVAEATDPACAIVNRLRQEFRQHDVELLIGLEPIGASAKISKLARLEQRVKHEFLVISDADVKAPPDLLLNVVAPLHDERVGLVNCFYQLANASTLPMRLEAVGTNADFWSQVLQSKSLKPLDFALGAVMATRRKQLAEVGGFAALADCLADDYQLGHRVAGRGYRIELCPVVVECWDAPRRWWAVWRHQVRWARTIRVCQPLPYFFSILGNAVFWPLAWVCTSLPQLAATARGSGTGLGAGLASVPFVPAMGLLLVLGRMILAANLQTRLSNGKSARTEFWLVPVKDLLQVFLWAAAFLGHTIEWRGETYRLRRDGTLTKQAAD